MTMMINASLGSVVCLTTPVPVFFSCMCMHGSRCVVEQCVNKCLRTGDR